ncbi:hypothetical protein BaRGS_00006701 [Batillaria attramentaria]|uniref:Uncharacterized protein n=1 Tax=Batillaria attramentaria TaxID=370345 RepID=A0ABD0LQI9_9CAEN
MISGTGSAKPRAGSSRSSVTFPAADGICRGKRLAVRKRETTAIDYGKNKVTKGRPHKMAVTLCLCRLHIVGGVSCSSRRK